MDLVFPLGNESRHQNIELTYSLRSIEKYLSSYDKVYIIGEKPNLKNIVYIPYREKKDSFFRDRNIYNKILYACNQQEISDPFLLVYDDHIFLKEYEPKYYHCGKLSLKEWHSSQNYYHTIRRTIDLLGNVNNFDCHSPLVIEKEKFKKINVDWSKMHGYLIKTLYCNINNIEGIYHKDFKLRQKDEPDITEPFLSLPGGVLRKNVLEFLQIQFPEKSTFEL